jgi:hypothetical protein
MSTILLLSLTMDCECPLWSFAWFNISDHYGCSRYWVSTKLLVTYNMSTLYARWTLICQSKYKTQVLWKKMCSREELKPKHQLWYYTIRHLLTNLIIKLRWYKSDQIVSYTIIQHYILSSNKKHVHLHIICQYREASSKLKVSLEILDWIVLFCQIKTHALSCLITTHHI